MKGRTGTAVPEASDEFSRGPRRSAARGEGPSALATCVGTAIAIAVSVILLWPQHGRALNWDEVDYVNAAHKGVVANLWERGSLSLPDYIRFAWSKVEHRKPDLPAGYEERNDPYYERHGHSPAIVAAIAPLSQSDSERAPRAVLLVGAALLTIALVVGYRLLSPTWTWVGLLAILLVAPWYNWKLFASIHFHGWTTIWLCLTVVFLSKWFTTGHKPAWGVATCLPLALSIVTLESSVLLLIGVVCALIVWERGLRRKARSHWVRSYVIPGLAIVGTLSFVIWPGMILKGSVLKVLADRYYQVFLGEGTVYYFNRSGSLFSYIVPLAIGAPTLLYLVRRKRDETLRWGPPVVVTIFYLASVLRFAVADHYFLPALAPLLVLFAWVLGDLSIRWQAAAGAALAVVMVLATASAVRTNDRDRRADQVLRSDIAFVGQLVGSSRGLIDGGHIFHYYLPARDITDVSYNRTDLLYRRGGEYVPVPEADYSGSVIGMMPRAALFLQGQRARELTERCTRIVRPTIVLWDCRSS